MTPKRLSLFHPFDSPFTLLLILFLIAGCGGGDSGSPAPSGGGAPDPKFSLPLPKGLLAPSPGSGLILTAKAIIDPGSAGARTVDLTIDSSANRVTGVIDGLPEGPHSLEIQYFINGVQVAIAALNVNVVAGQNTPVEISETLVNYVEAVSNTLFVADGANKSIAVFDRYSSLKGGTVTAAPTRTLLNSNTGLFPTGLFVDAIGGSLYVINDAPDPALDSVTIWNNAATATGDVAPARLLAGPSTRLNQPSGVTVDPFRNLLYVVNRSGEILIWNHASAVNGDIAPIAIVSGDLTGVNHPVYLDIKRDHLYVANGAEILIFDKLSLLTGPQTATPINKIPLASGVSQASLAVDPIRDLLFVSSRDPNGSIYQLPGASTAAGQIAASLKGTETGLNLVSGIAVAGNILFATNQGGNDIRVWHHAAEEKPENASPTQILAFTPPAAPAALFYVATQNAPAQDHEPVTLTVNIQGGNGNGRVTSDLPGINCGTTCSAPFQAGSTVTLAAIPEGDSTFTGWSGDCSGTDPCVVTTDSPKTVTAIFTLRPFALSVKKIGNGTVTSSPSGINCGGDCSEIYNINASVVLTAVPAADSNLASWTGCNSSSGATCTVLITSAKTVTATFNTKPLLTVTKSGTGGGTVTSNSTGISCGSDCSESYNNFTTQVTLTAAANSTSNFTGWS